MKLRSLSLSTSVEVKNGDQNMVILPIRKGSVSQITSHFEVNTHNLKEKYLFTCNNDIYFYPYWYLNRKQLLIIVVHFFDKFLSTVILL